MNAHPRLRKAAKWGGLGLAGVCVAAWAISMLCRPWGYFGAGRHGQLRKGVVMFRWLKPPELFDQAFARHRVGFEHDIFERPGPPQWHYEAWTAAGSSGVVVPVWPGAALGLAVGVPAWLLDRRARRCVLAGHCSKCRYDRSTLPAAAPCPECAAAGR